MKKKKKLCQLYIYITLDFEDQSNFQKIMTLDFFTTTIVVKIITLMRM